MPSTMPSTRSASRSAFASDLEALFGTGRVGEGVVLAPYTTFRVGGPADWFVEPRTRAELVGALDIARRHGVRAAVLGGGSNVLVSDAGVRGLVLRPRGGDVQWVSPTQIRASAAVTINGLVRWTITHAAAGLEAWAGTPGTVGGAMFGNAHFGGHLIGELVTQVELCSRDGVVSTVPARDMAFGYDRSRLQETGEILLSADFAVSAGDAAALRATAKASLAFRKRTQPLETPSAGCIFQNPEPGRDQLPSGMPWSAGALVDGAGLKGTAEGGARVSPAHGNFIVNTGGATAADIRALVERCRVSVRSQFGVELREEIVYFGN